MIDRSNLPPGLGGLTDFGLIEALAPLGGTFADGDATFMGAVADLIAGALELHRLHQELEQRAERDGTSFGTGATTAPSVVAQRAFARDVDPAVGAPTASAAVPSGRTEQEKRTSAYCPVA